MPISNTSSISSIPIKNGAFLRPASVFRDVISADPDTRFPAERGRYHLYVSYGCPWAHRTLIVRKLKGLENVVGATITSPHLGAEGWPFASVDPFPGAEEDPLYGSKYVKELYFKANPEYTGRFTVPVLWDSKHATIVNNESSEIIRIFNTAFDGLLGDDNSERLDPYPETLRGEIDELNNWVYDTVNNGVYKCGFATSQAVYDVAVTPLFASLDRLEGILEGNEFLVGGRLTEADVRLYVTIARFDPVYYNHFKANLKSIRHDYPNLNKWLKNLYWNYPAFKDTTNFEHINGGYYWSHTQTNPTRIVPIGPKFNVEPL